MTNYAVQTIREIQEIALKVNLMQMKRFKIWDYLRNKVALLNIFIHIKISLWVKDLADYFNVSTASIGGSLKVLEKHNYIKRTRKHENARQYDIIVLPLGESIIDDFDKK